MHLNALRGVSYARPPEELMLSILAAAWDVFTAGGRQRMKSREEREAARVQRQAEQEQQREDRQRSRQERQDEFRRNQEARQARKAATTWMPALGVCVRHGQVHQHGSHESGAHSDTLASAERSTGHATKLLGPLAGARAEVAGGKAGHRRSGHARVADAALATSMLGPFGLLAAASRKGTEGVAIVVFSDGAYHEKKIRDASSLVRAEADAVRFNALASAVRGQAGENAGSGTEATLIRLSCGHTAWIGDPRTIRWLSADADISYRCGKCGADRPVVAIGDDAAQVPEPVETESAATLGQLTDELERLANLYTSGALTEAEFQAAKARLLGL